MSYTALTDKHNSMIEANVWDWPQDKMTMRAVEELTELSTALLHYHRGKASVDDVLLELADVMIVLRHLEIKFGTFQEQLDAKVIKGNS